MPWQSCLSAFHFSCLTGLFAFQKNTRGSDWFLSDFMTSVMLKSLWKTRPTACMLFPLFLFLPSFGLPSVGSYTPALPASTLYIIARLQVGLSVWISLWGMFMSVSSLSFFFFFMTCSSPSPRSLISLTFQGQTVTWLRPNFTHSSLFRCDDNEIMRQVLWEQTDL